MRSSCRALLTSQRLAGIVADRHQQPAEHAFGHVAEKFGIDENGRSGHGRDQEAGYAVVLAQHEVQPRAGAGEAGNVTAERGAQQIGEALQFELAIEDGLAFGRHLDRGDIEQDADRADEHHGDKIRAELGQCRPRHAGEGERPRRREGPRRGHGEHPALRLGIGNRDPEQQEHDVETDDADQELGRHGERRFPILPPDDEEGGDRYSRSQFLRGADIEEMCRCWRRSAGSRSRCGKRRPASGTRTRRESRRSPDRAQSGWRGRGAPGQGRKEAVRSMRR